LDRGEESPTPGLPLAKGWKKRGEEMGTKAYFLINVDEQITQNQEHLIRATGELEKIPEVEFVEPVSGIYDLMVKVDVPIRTIFVANKILEKEWVTRLLVLRIEPVEHRRIEHIEPEKISELSVTHLPQA